jgi:hypothetical protein
VNTNIAASLFRYMESIERVSLDTPVGGLVEFGVFPCLASSGVLVAELIFDADGRIAIGMARQFSDPSIGFAWFQQIKRGWSARN